MKAWYKKWKALIILQTMEIALLVFYGSLSYQNTMGTAPVKGVQTSKSKVNRLLMPVSDY